MTNQPLSDIEIAQRAQLQPIAAIAKKLGIHYSMLQRYGEDKAKVSLDVLEQHRNRPDGKLVLVTAITPTPAGEGKTTTSVGLTDGLNRIGKQATVCLREPSLGPCFGMKGGAAGGGYAQVVPMEEINLHFTGDFHAVTSAHNLLAAVIDNHLHHGNALGLDWRTILWKRVIDLNDRALRDIVAGLGGTANSIPCESGFDITTASEVMAILCLSESLKELKQRFSEILVGFTRDHKAIHARDLNVHGAMAALMKHAIKPNIVQTLEGNPAFVHGGPFANIAHGCNSVVATKMSLKLSEYTVTEAGFGADLGAEKFFDIKCRVSGIRPDAVVIVATVRALKMHGGVELPQLKNENLEALKTGLANLKRHVENVRRFGLPAIVAVNVFPGDTEAELELLQRECAEVGIHAVRADHWARGGAGAEELAHAVVKTVESNSPDFTFLYPDDLPLWDKINLVCKEIYGAEHAVADKKVLAKLKQFEEDGFGNYPICIAKTQYSFTTYPHLKGAPSRFEIPIRDVRVSAGARFVVVIAGEILTMPGLPKVPAAENIDIDDTGNIVGLF